MSDWEVVGNGRAKTTASKILKTKKAKEALSCARQQLKAGQSFQFHELTDLINGSVDEIVFKISTTKTLKVVRGSKLYELEFHYYEDQP